jgi:rhodanese-related sulfurtransferase
MNDAEANPSELSAEQVEDLIASGAELIDVRRDYEWDGGRIAGARHIEMNKLSAAAESLPRERPIVFYCRGGNRSGMAAEAFRQGGWDAYHLAGGISAWAEAGHPLDPEDGEVRAPLPAS